RLRPRRGDRRVDARVRSLLHARDDAADACRGAPRPRLRLCVRADHPRLGAGTGRRRRRERRGGRGHLRRRALPRALRDRPAYACRAVEVTKLLVANRGEIALRVFRTARALGIATVAVAAPDDLGSLHARSADETERVGSYLWSEEHIQAALRTGADAIHPGYGFLAESGDFAEAVGAAGLLWIGPPPDAPRAGRHKLAAR